MDHRRSRTLVAILSLVALLLLTLDLRDGGEGFISSVQRGAQAVFAPVQEGFATVVRPVESAVQWAARLRMLSQRNQELEQTVDRLRVRQTRLRDLEYENAELRDLLAMRERLGYETVAARVIGSLPGGDENALLIDIGEDQGLRPGMAVLSSRGLVGKTVDVTGSHARIELLTSPEAHYVVRVVPSGQTGRMRGQGARPFQLELQDPQAVVAVGSEVVTRTFEGSTIPDGLPVGVVTDPGDAGSERLLSVRPYTDFRRIDLVHVVLDAPDQPSELPSGTGTTSERPVAP